MYHNKNRKYKNRKYWYTLGTHYIVINQIVVIDVPCTTIIFEK